MQPMIDALAGIPGLAATLAYDPQLVTDLCLLATGEDPGIDCCGFITDA